MLNFEGIHFAYSLGHDLYSHVEFGTFAISNHSIAKKIIQFRHRI